MAFYSRQVTNALTPHQVMFEFLEDMIARGFRVLGSGNGTTFENEGETAGSTGTGSGGGFHLFTAASQMNAQGAWLRLATPADAPHHREWVFRRSSGTGHSEFNWGVWVARDPDGFDTGAGASTRPTAADGLAIGHANPSTSLSAVLFPNWRYMAYWTIGDVEDDYSFMFWTVRSANTYELFSAVGWTRVRAPFLGDDPDPYLYFFKGKTMTSTTNASLVYGLHNVDGSDTPQESITGDGTPMEQFRAFASFRYGQGHAQSGTYQVGLAQAVGGSGTTPNNRPLHQVGKTGSANLRTHLNPAIAYRGVTASAVRFIKGVHSSRILRLTHDTAKHPYLIRPVGDGPWYAVFWGVAFAWEPGRGIFF